jgi:hypothetical protein
MTAVVISPLLQRMIEDMTIRNLTPQNSARRRPRGQELCRLSRTPA